MKTVSVMLAILNLSVLLISQLSAPVKALPAPGADLVVQPRVPRAARDHCHQMHSCHFYSHCIESVFPCGQQGFILSYAKQRCEKIDEIRPLVGRKARHWAHSAEECFKGKLLDLVDSYVNSLHHPDPHTCLNFEAEAIEMMNQCYKDAPQMDAVPTHDLVKVVNLFRIDPAYHNLTVDRGLVEHIRNVKGDSLADSLLSNHTLSMPNRLILCIKGTKYPHGIDEDEIEPTPEEFITILKTAFPTLSQGSVFQYGGPDDVDSLCIARTHDPDLVGDFNTNNNDYHLVSLFTTDTFDEVINLGTTLHNEDITAHATIFELTTLTGNFTRQQSQCGDGKRQVGESCDFSYAYPGCSLDCQLMDSYDCIVDKLEQSECKLEVCGDGRRSKNEDCDDGNLDNSDGCSETCKIEGLTHTCTKDYNKTSECVSMVPLQQQVQPASAKLLAQATSHVTARHAPASSVQHSQEQTTVQHAKRTLQPAAFISCATRNTSTWTSFVAGLLALALVSMLR